MVALWATCHPNLLGTVPSNSDLHIVRDVAFVAIADAISAAKYLI